MLLAVLVGLRISHCDFQCAKDYTTGTTVNTANLRVFFNCLASWMWKEPTPAVCKQNMKIKTAVWAYIL